MNAGLKVEFRVLLNDSKGNYWVKFIRSFRDQLIIGTKNGQIVAEQTVTLWHKKVLHFNYEIEPKK